jgi:hypothetical protein
MANFLHTLLLIVLFVPMLVYGQDTGKLSYISMTVLPGGLQLQSANLSTLLSSVYYLAIGIAALLAVFKIIIAGVKFMLTDAVPSRSSAKDDIQSALLGLILIISAVLILNVINPTIVGSDKATPTPLTDMRDLG